MNYLDFPYLSERWTMHLVGMNIGGGGGSKCETLPLFTMFKMCFWGSRYMYIFV